jgi:acetylornithine deacetylase
MIPDVVQMARELVAIPSVNPMGRPLEGPEFYEYRVTEYLETFFDSLGLPWQRQHVDTKRDNIIARLDGRLPPSEGGAVVLWEAHQDTVPVDGMTIEPWTPEIRDNRMYGRGSCDIKGGMAAMLTALARLAEERPSDMPTIIMACTVNEEHGYTGATALTKLWLTGEQSIVPRRPDACVVAEPTDLNVVVSHKGTARWKLHTLGRAMHSSQPHLGDNAIYQMGRVTAALEKYATEFAPRLSADPLCGPVTLSVGTIRGGLSVNTVPDRCTIEIDRRVVPGEKAAEAYDQVRQYLGDFPGLRAHIQHDPLLMAGSPLPATHNGPLAERLSSVARELTARGAKVGVAYGTDAAKFAEAGVPSVVFGPGSIAQAHTADEWLPLDELHQAVDVLCEFARRGL